MMEFQSPLVVKMHKNGARESVRESRLAWDPLDTSYIPIEEREVDEENELKPQTGNVVHRPELDQDISRPKGKWSSFLSLPSFAFVLAAVTCFALTGVLSTVDTSGMNLHSDSSDDYSKTAAIDCSRLQTTGVANLWTHSQLDSSGSFDYYNDTHGNVSHFEETFMLDIKTPPSMTFVQVKVVDVMWQLLGGQGIRFLMGYITYIVGCQALVVFMKKSRVSYDYFIAVAFQGSSLSTIVAALKEFYFLPRHRYFGGWSIMLWMVVSIIYTLSIPSLLSATTGYMVPSEAYWQMPDSSMVSDLSNATRACWLVQDGSRVGLSNNAYVSGPAYSPFQVQMNSYAYDGIGQCQDINLDYPLFNNITNYYCGLLELIESLAKAAAEQYEDCEPSANDCMNASAMYANSSTTIFINNTSIDIPAPPLSLGTLGTPVSVSLINSWPTYQRCYNDQVLPSDFTPPLYCVSTTNKYSFGISKNMSMGILITQGFWCLSTWLVWLYVSSRSKRLGLFQTALVLTEAMQNDLGSDLYEYSEERLSKELARGKGISFSSAENDGLRRRDI